MNVKKKFIHHTTGSRGYAGKEETWQEQELKAIQSGATLETSNWTEWSKRFILGHGAILAAKGRMEFKINKVKQEVEMIEKAHAESEEGTFVPSRNMDELNYALQSKEHPGCTRGYKNKPWKHALKSTADTMGKRENMMSYSKTRYKNVCRTFYRMRGKRCMSHFKGIYNKMCKNRCKHNYNNYWVNKEMLWSCTALVGIIVIAHLQLL
jgi:hypothetical protein